MKAIEAKGFTFTQTMMDNSEQIARLINEASESGDRHRSRGRSRNCRRSHSAAIEASSDAVHRARSRICATAPNWRRRAPSKTIARTLRELQETTQAAIEQSKQTASAAVSEMLETHSMLRSDTTALFERLREANILLQEVLSGAHENMSAIESTLVTRVSDFVATMNEVATEDRRGQQPGRAAHRELPVRHQPGARRPQQLASQFDAHGRALAEAVALIDRSNRRTEGALTERRAELDTLVDHARQQGPTISNSGSSASPSLLDQSLEGASDRARDIARLVAESTTGGARAIAENFEAIRTTPRRSASAPRETMRSIYEQSTGDSHAMCRRAAAALHRRRSAGHEADGRRDAARARSDPRASCARASSNCRRRPPRAPRRCAASSSTRSRRWPSSTASSPAMAAVSTRSSRPRARRAGSSRRRRPRSRAACARERAGA